MGDPRYWTSGHPERRAYTDWVTEGWQRLASSPHRTADGAATVFVRAYARVRNGRTEQVGAYTRSGHAGEGGSSDIIPIAAPRRPDGRMRTGPLGPDELDMGGGGGGARRVSPPSNQPTAPHVTPTNPSPAAAGSPSGPRNVLFDRPRAFQRKFADHAAELGIGNWNSTNAARFEQAIREHVAAPSSLRIEGTYRGGSPVIHYLNPETRLNVMTDRSGSFISVWRLNEQQFLNVYNRGSL